MLNLIQVFFYQNDLNITPLLSALLNLSDALLLNLEHAIYV